MFVTIAVGLAITLLLSWLGLAVFLLLRRPEEGFLAGALRLLPDVVGLLGGVARDRQLPRGVRIRLWLLLAYLAFPIDIVPDFIPVIGYADDIVIVGATLRSVVRRAGPDAVRRHWRGTTEGLATVWRLARLPGDP